MKQKNYIDWGTYEDWTKYISQYQTLFIDLDGVLVENSAEYLKPYWGTTDGIKENIEKINELYDSGKVCIIITTSRSTNYGEKTHKQLKKLGVKYHQILYDLPHCKRVIINDFAPSNPYPSCEAINIQRNSKNLSDML